MATPSLTRQATDSRFKRRAHFHFSHVVVYAVLLLLAFTCLIPFYSMIIDATHSSIDIANGVYVLPGTELKVALSVGDYELALKGQVRHGDQNAGLGIEFREIRKGERQILQFLMRKLAEKHLEDTLQFEVHR